MAEPLATELLFVGDMNVASLSSSSWSSLLSVVGAMSALCAAGCLSSDAGPDGEAPHAPPTQPSPAPPPQPAPSVPVASGVYQVTSEIDLTAEAVLPAPAADFVVTLREFSTQPAHTLFTLADEAGVPAIAELRAALPDALESRLEGWIDDELAAVRLGGVPLTTRAAELAALAESTLTRFALRSELDLRASVAVHQLTALDLRPAGLELVLPLAALPGDVTRAPLTATTTAAGQLTLGDHPFGLSYGEYVWRALEETSRRQHGAELRPALGAAVSCPAVAARIANKCVLGLCVGHASLLTQLCERGPDEVVARAHAEVASLRFSALRLAAGTATVSADASSLSAGVWTAQLNAGQGLRPAPATFTAAR